MITKLKGRYVIGYESDDHVIIEDGQVVYKDDKIVYVGKNYEGKVNEEIDYGNSIISPGFIDLDALGDIDHTLIFNEISPEEKNNLYWSEDYFDNHRKEWMSPEEEAFKSYYAYSQLIMNGITTAMPITSVNYKKSGETYEEIVAAAHNAGKLGLRVYLGPSYVSGMHVIENNKEMTVKWMIDEGKEGLKDAIKFVEIFDGAYDGLINGVLVPERIELQTEDILRETKEYAKKHNILVRLHAAQGEFEYNTIYKKHGKSTIQYLDSIGFLDENTLIPHGIYSSGFSKLEDQSNRDQEIMIERGASFIHCPLVYSRTGHALESFGRYVRLGINISMGTDCFPPDMIKNFTVGVPLALHIDEARPENYFREYYRAATLGGAKALGRDDLGRLEEGAKADIIVIDLDGYHIGVIDDPIRTLCLSGSGSDVKTSIINGKVVMENRSIPSFDYEEAKRKAQIYYEKMKSSYMERAFTNLSEEEFFKLSFRTIK